MVSLLGGGERRWDSGFSFDFLSWSARGGGLPIPGPGERAGLLGFQSRAPAPIFFSVGDARHVQFKASVFDQSIDNNRASLATIEGIGARVSDGTIRRALSRRVADRRNSTGPKSTESSIPRPHLYTRQSGPRIQQTCSSQLRPPASFSITRTLWRSIALPSQLSRRG